MFSSDTNTTNTLVHTIQPLKPCGAKKTTQKIVKERMKKKKAEYVKIEQPVKTIFFEALPWLKSKNSRLTKVF